jgi:hypothetical protein
MKVAAISIGLSLSLLRHPYCTNVTLFDRKQNGKNILCAKFIINGWCAIVSRIACGSAILGQSVIPQQIRKWR